MFRDIAGSPFAPGRVELVRRLDLTQEWELDRLWHPQVLLMGVPVSTMDCVNSGVSLDPLLLECVTLIICRWLIDHSVSPAKDSPLYHLVSCLITTTQSPQPLL